MKNEAPSDYSLDLFKVTPGHIPTSDMRRRFASVADAERGNVEVVHVLNGGFLDRGVLFGFLRMIDVDTQTAYVWGDGKHHPARVLVTQADEHVTFVEPSGGGVSDKETERNWPRLRELQSEA